MPNILIVDDSEDLLEILSTFLIMRGHNVETVSSIDKAKNALSIFIPDIILLDVRLHGEDGRELCREIKEKHAHHISIILISASPTLLKDYDGCKADGVIEKPFDIQMVIDKVAEVLGTKTDLQLLN